MNVKFIAVGLVAILIVAGSAVFLLAGDDDENQLPKNEDGRLMIFGNATNDDYLDEDDLELIESIAKGSVQWDKTKNPYADANHDGEVNFADVEFVKRLIARESMDIWYVDGDNKVQQIHYPLKTIAIVGTQQMIAAQAMGILDKVAGVSGTPLVFDNVLHKTLSTRPSISNSPTKIDITMYSNVAQTVPGGIDAVLCAASGLTSQQEACDQAGITLVRMDSSTLKGEIRTFLTFGYLMQNEKRSHDLAQFIDAFNADMNKKLDTIPDDKRITSLVLSSNTKSFMGGLVCSNTRAFSERVNLVGTHNNITNADLGNDEKKMIAEGDVWHLSAKYQSDVVVDMVTGFGYNTTAEDFAKFWERIFEAPEFSMTKMSAYPNGFAVISRDIPGPVMMGYYAEFFYPEVFGEGYGDKVHQAWCDRFFEDLGPDFDASKQIILCTYDDVKDLLKK